MYLSTVPRQEWAHNCIIIISSDVLMQALFMLVTVELTKSF